MSIGPAQRPGVQLGSHHLQLSLWWVQQHQGPSPLCCGSHHPEVPKVWERGAVAPAAHLLPRPSPASPPILRPWESHLARPGQGAGAIHHLAPGATMIEVALGQLPALLGARSTRHIPGWSLSHACPLPQTAVSRCPLAQAGFWVPRGQCAGRTFLRD